MSLSGGRNKLFHALEVVQAHWDETTPRWADVVRKDFEENYWAPIEPTVKATLQAMDRLEQVLRKLRNVCG